MRLDLKADELFFHFHFPKHSNIQRHLFLYFSLKLHAQKLLQALGSGLIDKLTFRDVWAFVGQKGIEGFSSFEQVLRKKISVGVFGAFSFKISLGTLLNQ